MNTKLQRNNPLPYFVKIGLVSFTYFGAAKVGLGLSAVHGSVSLLWPPTGVALAIVLLYGWRLWPGILLGAFIANELTNGPVSFAIIAAIGNTLEALVGAYLLRRFAGFHNALDRTQDITGLVVLGAGVSTLVSATIGVLGICLTGMASWREFGSIWLVWWLGDAIGDLVIAPVLLSWGSRRTYKFTLWQVIEIISWLILISLIAVLTFSGQISNAPTGFSLAYLLFPFLMWAALRFGQRGTTIGTLIVSSFAVWGTLNELGPFARQSVNETLLFLWIFMGVVTITAMFLAATVIERNSAEGALKRREEQFRLFFEHAPIGMAVVGIDGQYKRVNQAYSNLLGYSVEELVTHKFADLTYPDDVEMSLSLYRQLLEGKIDTYQLDKRFINKANKPVVASIQVTLLRDSQGLPLQSLEQIVDISERKMAEAILQAKVKEEHEFQKYLKALHEITIELTAINDLDEFYKRAVELGLQRLGFERSGLFIYDEEQSVAVGTYGTDAQGNLTAEHQLRLDPAQLTGILIRAFQKDDRFVLDEQAQLFSGLEPVGIGWNAVAVLWNGSEKLGWLAIDNGVQHRPIAESVLEVLVLYALTLGTLLSQKRAQIGLHESQAQLRRSEEMFRFLVQGAKEYASYLLTPNGQIGSWNSGAERISGYSAEDVLGQHFSLFFTPEDKSSEKPQHLLHTAESSGHVEDQGWRVRKDGSRFWADVVITALRNEDGTLYGFAKLARDLTERKRAEVALRASEKLDKELFLEIDRQTQELALLDRVRTALARELDLPSVYRKVVEAVTEAYGYTQVSIYRTEGNESVLQYQIGYSTVIERMPITAGVSGRVLSSGQPILVEDIKSDPDFLAAIDGLTSEICVPLLDQGKVVGFFNIESSNENHLTQSDLGLMTALSQHINIAIERARHYTEARENEAWFRLLFDLAPIGMTVVGLDGRFQRVNRAYGALVGYTPEELIGHNFMDLTYPDDIPGNLSLFSQLAKGEIPDYQVEKRYIARSEKLVTVIWRVSLLRDSRGHPINVIGQALDITERILVEQRTLELTAEKQRVVFLNDFIRDVSHEFRTPLATIDACTYVLNKTTDPRHLQEATDRIARQVKHLIQILEQSLTMSELDSIDSLPIESVTLNQLVEDVVVGIDVLAESKHHRVIRNLGIEVAQIQANPEQLALALANILENAAQFTPEGGIITLATRRNSSSVVIEVIDKGTGITQEALPHVFERLYRADQARTIQDTGVGLGLSIAKRIVDLHHGTIEVESIPGQGSTFRIVLPVQILSQ